MKVMLYFAYGSNMSISRIRERVPSAVPLGCHGLKGHDLRFHKSGNDGSAKCDAYFTANAEDVVYGALFRMNSSEKPRLDSAEGLGRGYDEKQVTVIARDGALIMAMTYVATRIDASLQPFSWYLNHVLIGARETSLPVEYIERCINPVEVIEDPDKDRDAAQWAIHR